MDMDCPKCGAALHGPCGDSAWGAVWVYACSDDECSVEVSMDAPDPTLCECGHTLQPSGEGDYVCVMGCRYQAERNTKETDE